MGTSNLDRLIMSPPDFSDVDCRKLSNIQDHHHFNLSPSTPDIANQTKDQDQTKNKEDANSVVNRGLKIQVITSFAGEFSKDNHPKTPTSREHKIPAMSTCPPAPRKAKWVSKIGKRKAPFFVAVGDPAADFMVYVDAMLALNEVVYVPDIVVGDLGSGDCAKRLKTLAHQS